MAHRVYIIDSLEEVEKYIHKRASIPPLRLLKSASEDENLQTAKAKEIDEKCLKMCCVSLSNVNVTEFQGKENICTLNDKKITLTSFGNGTSEQDASLPSVDSTNEIRDLNLNLDKKSIHKVIEKKKGETLETIENPIVTTGGNLAEKGNGDEVVNAPSINYLSSSDGQSTPTNKKKKYTKSLSDSKAKKDQDLIKTIVNVHNASECHAKQKDVKTENEELKRNLSELKRKVKVLEDDVKKYKSIRNDFKKKYQSILVENKELHKRNIDIQDVLISSNKERDAIIEKLSAVAENATHGDTYPKIESYRMVDNIKMIHIGLGQYITERGFSGLIATSKTPQQCAYSILTLVFTDDELLKCTISGYESNKKKSKKKNDTGGNHCSNQNVSRKIPCGKLDEVKFAACKGFYDHWMEKHCKLSESSSDYLENVGKFAKWAGKKIADLKRPPRKKSKKDVSVKDKAAGTANNLRNHSEKSDSQSDCHESEEKMPKELEMDTEVYTQSQASVAGPSGFCKSDFYDFPSDEDSN